MQLKKFLNLKRKAQKYLAEIDNIRDMNSLKGVLHYLPFFPRWNRYIEDVSNVLRNDMPWLNFEAMDYLDKILTSEMRVFEYSSGGSTLFFSKRVKEVLSIEHDEGWYEKIAQTISAMKIRNCAIKLIKPELTSAFHEGIHDVPGSYLSSDAAYQGGRFVSYARSIDSCPDAHFDVVLIDGRARISCFTHACRKIKAGGYLILDNSEREEYKYIHSALSNPDWERKSFFGPGPYVYSFWGTTFWRRSR